MVYQKDKVNDVIAVLTIMKAESSNSISYQSAAKLRILATKVVAGKGFDDGRFVSMVSARTTIHDALARRLGPDIKGIVLFDELASQWLRNESTKLRDILLGYAIDSVQKSVVEKFFLPLSNNQT